MSHAYTYEEGLDPEEKFVRSCPEIDAVFAQNLEFQALVFLMVYPGDPDEKVYKISGVAAPLICQWE